MTVVAADGQYVHPVTVDEFRIAVAETLDVIVEPRGQDAYTIFAQSVDRTGYARGTLAVRPGLAAEVPDVDPRPVLTMADMGHGHDMAGAHGQMSHGSGAATGSGHDAHGATPAPDPHAGHQMPMDPPPAASAPDPHAAHQGAGMAGMSHDSMSSTGMQSHPASEAGNPLVDMQTMAPTLEAG